MYYNKLKNGGGGGVVGYLQIIEKREGITQHIARHESSGWVFLLWGGHTAFRSDRSHFTQHHQPQSFPPKLIPSILLPGGRYRYEWSFPIRISRELPQIPMPRVTTVHCLQSRCLAVPMDTCDPTSALRRLQTATKNSGPHCQQSRMAIILVVAGRNRVAW